MAATQEQPTDEHIGDEASLVSFRQDIDRREEMLRWIRGQRDEHVARCVKRGMPVTQVARALGISPRAVYQILEGRT